MKTSKFYVLVSYALIFAIYNILAWIIMPKGSPNFWVGYIATVLAFLICVMTTLLSEKAGSSRDDAIVKGIPVMVIVIGFLCVQSVFGLVVMLLPGVMTKAIVVVEIIFFLIFGVIAFVLEATKSYGDETDGTNDQKVNTRTEIVNKLQKSYRNTSNGEIKSSLIELTDYIKTCNGELLVENSDRIFGLINQIQTLTEVKQYSQIKEVIKEVKMIF